VNVGGNVSLTGTVPSYPQYLEAAAAARRVAGAVTVDNHLEVVLAESDFRDDAMLTTAANNALAHNVTVPDGVEATADDSNITLTGTVSLFILILVLEHGLITGRRGGSWRGEAPGR
jgi:osmotically-inducible protein OsmY